MRSHAPTPPAYIIGDDLSVARAAIDSGALTTIVRQLSDNETVARPDYSEADEDDESVEVLEFREVSLVVSDCYPRARHYQGSVYSAWSSCKVGS